MDIDILMLLSRWDTPEITLCYEFINVSTWIRNKISESKVSTYWHIRSIDFGYETAKTDFLRCIGDF